MDNEEYGICDVLACHLPMITMALVRLVLFRFLREAIHSWCVNNACGIYAHIILRLVAYLLTASGLMVVVKSETLFRHKYVSVIKKFKS